METIAQKERKENSCFDYNKRRQAVKYNSPKKRFPTSVIMELQKHKKQEEGNLWRV